MPVARARSRLVKLILPMASTIGRASNLVMSICSTGVARSSDLRVSLTLLRSISCSVVIANTSSFPRKRESRYSRCQLKNRVAPAFAGLELSLREGSPSNLRRSAVEARHGLIVDDRGVGHSEAVELRAHCRTVSAEHADL